MERESDSELPRFLFNPSSCSSLVVRFRAFQRFFVAKCRPLLPPYSSLPPPSLFSPYSPQVLALSSPNHTFHSGQTQDACAVPAIILQNKTQTNVGSFTLTAISENLSFLLRACVQNEVTGIHKFYRRGIFFIRHFMHRFHTNFTLVKV